METDVVHIRPARTKDASALADVYAEAWRGAYRGMIVGEHTRDNDLEINVLKGKQLTNIRAAGKDEAVRLTPPIKMTLEKALAYIEDDELVEVTPKSIRLRKKLLDENDRKKEERKKEAETV